MIAWWWIPVVLAGMWLALVIVGAVTNREVREALSVVALSVAMLPALPLVAAWSWLNVGTVRLSPRTLARFASARTVDKRPAWAFFVRKRGVIILREWRVGDDRPVVRINPEWRTTGGSIIAKQDTEESR